MHLFYKLFRLTFLEENLSDILNILRHFGREQSEMEWESTGLQLLNLKLQDSRRVWTKLRLCSPRRLKPWSTNYARCARANNSSSTLSLSTKSHTTVEDQCAMQSRTCAKNYRAPFCLFYDQLRTIWLELIPTEIVLNWIRTHFKIVICTRLHFWGVLLGGP